MNPDMRSQLIDATRQHDSLTANGAITHSTSLDNCVDMFFHAGGSRGWTEEDMIHLFERARMQDKNIAYKLLFWSRDARGGAGERRFFQVVAKHVRAMYPGEWDQLFDFTPLYGYWKDFFAIEKPDTFTLDWLVDQFETHPHANLLAKWFPRKGPWFVAMHKHLNFTPRLFRKFLAENTDVVETKMCNKEWDSILYSKVPSVAMNTYRNAFMKHDGIRFDTFNKAVLAGDEKVNASVLFPHLLYQAIQWGQDETAVEAQWKSLPNYMEGSEERIIPVCDVSGSMTGLPMDVSVALGLYIAERNESIFKNAFITFSSTPTMEYFMEEATLAQKMRTIDSAHWGMSTNLQATFQLILDSAVRASVPADQMPTKVLIISDMEFDMACDNTNLEGIRLQYAAAGYEMPELIFWNVNARLGNVPARVDEPGVGLVSGFSPSILTSILAGKSLTPVSLMMEVVESERYAQIEIDE